MTEISGSAKSMAFSQTGTWFWENASFYDQMCQKARVLLRSQNCEETFQPEDLVHDVYLRLAASGIGLRVADGTHYLAIAVRTMRRSLIDRSRAAKAFKRCGNLTKAELSDQIPCRRRASADSLWVNDLLDKCISQGARFALVARLHFLEGKTVPEIAQLLGTSGRTVKRDLQSATRQIRRHLNSSGR